MHTQLLVSGTEITVQSKKQYLVLAKFNQQATLCNSQASSWYQTLSCEAKKKKKRKTTNQPFLSHS